MFGEIYGNLIWADSSQQGTDYDYRTVNKMDDTWEVVKNPRGTVHNCEDD